MSSGLKTWRRARTVREIPVGESVSPTRDVYCAIAEERGVLLDLNRCRYLGLDEVGTRIWQGIEAGASRSEIVAALAAEYDAPETQLDRDTQRFMQDLLDRDLISTGTHRPAAPPGFLACYAMIVLVDIGIRLLGMRRMLILARCAKAAVSVRLWNAAEPDLANESARRLTLAAAFYFRRALCLEQSLALVFLLCRRGMPAEFVIAASALPFTAHAWIAVHDRVVYEPFDVPFQLTSFGLAGA